jgi:hypothetical protein
VLSLDLRREWCNRTNLATVARIQELRELRLHSGALDAAGVGSLATSPSLSSLSFVCCGQLPAGVLSAAAKLPKIRRLELLASDPPSSEYMALAGMSNLTELVITYSRNFTDVDFYNLENAPALRSVEIQSDALTPFATKMLSQFQFRFLTNALLSGKTVWSTNWQPHAERTEPRDKR